MSCTEGNVSSSFSLDTGITSFILDNGTFALTMTAFGALAALIGNATVIALFLSNKDLRIFTNYFVLNLAVSDLICGVIGHPFANLTVYFLPEYPQLGYLITCALSGALVYLTIHMSLLSILAIIIDRFIAVQWPLHYANWVTPRRVKIAIATIWIFVAILMILFTMVASTALNVTPSTCRQLQAPLYTLLSVSMLVFIGLTSVPSVTLSILTIRTARRQSRRVHCELARQNNPPRNMTSTLQTIKTYIIIACGLIISRSLIAVTPRIAWSCTRCVCESWFAYLVGTSCVARQLMPAVNPWVHTLTNRSFRRALIKRLSCNSR